VSDANSLLIRDKLSADDYNSVRQMSYIALDVPNAEDAFRVVEYFDGIVDGYKVGLQLFHADGQKVVDSLLKKGKRVFLDVKLHDIPNTVAGALAAICDSPIEMVNVHALGGRRMMEAAREAVNAAFYHPLLIAVTILTSISDDELADVGISHTALSEVGRLSVLAESCSIDGVVASARELPTIKQLTKPGFETVIPGTRPKGGLLHDQRRTLTPGEAILQGASRLVLGRAVLQAEEPLLALNEIWDDMQVHLNKANR
jgi:orotidine-5'-phosphate decarboxylase